MKLNPSFTDGCTVYLVRYYNIYIRILRILRILRLLVLMDEGYSLTIVDSDDQDITTNIQDICASKYDHTRVIPILQKFHRIRISKHDGEEKQYQLSTPPFFTYGGLGIVLGLIDFNGEPQENPPQQAVQYVLHLFSFKTPILYENL